MVPTINTTGMFTFGAPYNTLISAEQQLTVTSIRTLVDLQASSEDPLNNIYIAAGATDAIFLADLQAQIPIIVFRTEGDEYLYIPANKVLSDAKLTGVKYIEKTLIVNLGYLPATTDLTLPTSLITDAIYTAIGVAPSIIPTDTSATVSVPDIKHKTLELTRTNQKTVSKSYKTRYQELLTLYNSQKILIDNINQVYVTKGIAG